MRRHRDWARSLNAALEAQRGQPFDWATRNCLSVCCDAIQAMTGEDPLEPYRPLYHDEASAMAVVGEHGDLFGFVRHLLGEPMGNARYAKNGDLFVVRLPSGPTAGIGVDTTIWCMERQGMLTVNKERALRLGLEHAAWPIGWEPR